MGKCEFYSLACMCTHVANTPFSLSQDLLKYVGDDNESFLKELIEHDRNIQTAGHVSGWRAIHYFWGGG